MRESRFGLVMVALAAGTILAACSTPQPAPTPTVETRPQATAITRATPTRAVTRPPATTVASPAATTAPATAAPSPTPAPTGPAFEGITYRDEFAGWELSYPTGWSITDVSPEIKEQSVAYSVTLTSWKPDVGGGQGIPPGGTKVDVTVIKGTANTLEQAIQQRKQQHATSDPPVTIAAEAEWTLADGLKAVRWQLQTGSDQAVEVVMAIHGHLVLLDGYGDLALVDQIARTLHAIEPNT